MRIYVAAASDEIERAKAVMARLRDLGHEIVSTWPQVIEQVGAANPRDATREQCWEWTTKDLKEVDSAQLFLFLVPDKSPGRGGYYEFGHFSAARLFRSAPHWSIVSGDTKQSIFRGRADYEFATDDEAIAQICQIAAL